MRHSHGPPMTRENKGVSRLLDRVPHGWAVPLLLAVFVGCGVFAALRESATFDETTHLPAGFTYLDRGDFRHNPEHPPLAKAWAAVPLWVPGLAKADYTSPNWNGTHVPPGDPQRSRADQWKFGFEFLNGRIDDPARKDPRRLLVPGRCAMLVPALLLGFLVYAWAREIWGRGGGLVALALFSLSPTILAHAHLVTTDVPAALGFAATLWSFWRFCRSPHWRWALGTGFALGIALLTKYTTLLLLPLLLLLGAMWILDGKGFAERRRRFLATSAGIAAALVIAFVTLWAGYLFRYSAVTDPGYRLEWEGVSGGGGVARRVGDWARDHRILPEAYLFGLAYARGGAQRRLAFLNGKVSVRGWWYYFPEAFALKTPPAFMLLLLWVIAAHLRRTRGRSFAGWFVAAPIVFFFVVSMLSHLNIGHRHLLPVYPLLFVAAGGAATLIEESRPRAAVAGLLLAGCAGSFLLATPRYLSYFNFIAGGPRGGWRYLADSNIDWGQDLPRLRAWIERNGVKQVHLAYFGTADPKAYGIPYRKVTLVHDFYPAEPASRPGSGEYLAVSVTLLQGFYTDPDKEFAKEVVGRGWASSGQLQDFVKYRERLFDVTRRVPSLGEWMVEKGILTPDQRRAVEEPLLTTWLLKIRETLVPVGRAGESSLIFRIP